MEFSYIFSDIPRKSLIAMTHPCRSLFNLSVHIDIRVTRYFSLAVLYLVSAMLHSYNKSFINKRKYPGTAFDQ